MPLYLFASDDEDGGEVREYASDTKAILAWKEGNTRLFYPRVIRLPEADAEQPERRVGKAELVARTFKDGEKEVEQVRVRYFAVSLDETRDWNLGLFDGPRPQQVRSIWLVTLDESTYLCEGTPSVTLHYCARTSVWEEYPDDAVVDAFDTFLAGGEITPVDYMHRYDLLARFSGLQAAWEQDECIEGKTRGENWQYVGTGLTPDDEDTLAEYVMCNGVLQ